MYDLYPDYIVCDFKGFKEGDLGLYYNKHLKLLLAGRILNHKLIGRVIHDGLTKKDIDEGRYFRAFRIGYTYGDWDKYDFIYLGHVTNYTTLTGYLNFINTRSNKEIEAYFKAKPLVNEVYKLS